MLAMIGQLANAVWKAIVILAQFLAVVFLGLLAAILFALPWVIRMVTIVVWLVGGSLAIQSIDELYGPYTPAGPLIALQFVVIFLMTAWVGVLLLKAPSYIWGGLLAGGLLSGWISWQGIPEILKHWRDADLFFRLLPPALLALVMMYLTLRLRWLRSNRQLKPVTPAFLWLPKAVHQAKERFQQQRGNHE